MIIDRATTMIIVTNRITLSEHINISLKKYLNNFFIFPPLFKYHIVYLEDSQGLF